MKGSYNDIYSQIILVSNHKKKLHAWLQGELNATEVQVMSLQHTNIGKTHYFFMLLWFDGHCNSKCNTEHISVSE